MSKVTENVRRVAVGKISRVHGVRGAVKIYPYGDSLGEQKAGDRLYLSDTVEGGGENALTVVDLRRQQRQFIGRFREIISLKDAARVTGEQLYLPENRLSPTSEGEYYYFQLIGLKVETKGGKKLGELTGIIETGGNDVYVVRAQDDELLIPALEDTVLEVNLELGVMIVDPPEGLIDDL